jgi:hydroxypyruvate reductase
LFVGGLADFQKGLGIYMTSTSRKCERVWLEQLYLSSLSGMAGDVLVQEALRGHPICDVPPGSLVVFAAGKAASAMASGVESSLGPLRGVGVTRKGYPCKPSWLDWFEAGHPIPDQTSMEAARAFLAMAERMAGGERFLFLLSGGASSLLAAPEEGLTLAQLISLNRSLLSCGASIHEINIVRSAVSAIKGGKWLARATASMGWTMAISDVSGDVPASIGSGPTVPVAASFEDALAILRQYALVDDCRAVASFLETKSQTRKRVISVSCVHSFSIIADQHRWKQSIEKMLAEEGTMVVSLSSMDRKVETVADELSDWINQIDEKGMSGVAGVVTGEPVVVLPSHCHERGGRMLHLGMLLARIIDGNTGWYALAAGSDGSDGQTTKAGCLVDWHTWTRVKEAGFQPECLVDSFASDVFHEAADTAVVTGPTGTNICDVVILYR